MTADKKRKWWMIPVFVVLTAALAAGVFWDSVSVYLAPKTVLRSALDQTWQALAERFDGSPLLVLGNVLQEDGQNTIQLELNTRDDLLGEIRYHMTAQTQLAPKRILAKGTAVTGGKAVDLSLYLDHAFAAVSSDSLLSSNFYGITYDTFSEDIRSNAVLAFVLGEKTIGELEESVASLQESMSGEIVIPQITQADIRMAMMGIYALKADVSRETVPLKEGERECFCIQFQATGEEILKAAEMAQMELPFELDGASVLTAAFYLAEDTVVHCRLGITGGGEESCIVLTPDVHPATDDMTFRLETPQQAFTAVISTIHSEAAYTEQIKLKNADGESDFRYSWETDGDLQLSCKDNEGEKAVSLNLKETEDGFRLETGDIDGLLAILFDHEDEADNSCTMTVGKGTAFDTPEYKNFSQWSLEDVLSLLGNIGRLIGLKIA